MEAIKETNFTFKGQTGFYRGKVRDVYYFGDQMALVATDRISAFDVVLTNWRKSSMTVRQGDL